MFNTAKFQNYKQKHRIAAQGCRSLRKKKRRKRKIVIVISSPITSQYFVVSSIHISHRACLRITLIEHVLELSPKCSHSVNMKFVSHFVLVNIVNIVNDNVNTQPAGK